MDDRLPFEKREDEVFVKKESGTSEKFGCNPEDRSVEQLMQYGVVNVNKPQGPTSHQAADYVKRILKVDKAGHSGTLDPNVTGVLPVALAKGTRVTQALLNAGKEYVCLMKIHKEVEIPALKEAMKKFVGRIEQLPPVRSAVKRQLRQRSIYYFIILDIVHHHEINRKEVLFKVGCEAGTYIRKLVHDFGQALGTGAHMDQLVRTKAGPFKEKDWVSLQDLQDAYAFWKEDGNEKEIRRCIRPYETAVSHLPKIWVLDSAVDTLCHGASLSVPGVSKFNQFTEGEVVAVMTLKNELICLGNARMDSLKLSKESKGLVISNTKVFMERGIYQKP